MFAPGSSAPVLQRPVEVLACNVDRRKDFAGAMAALRIGSRLDGAGQARHDDSRLAVQLRQHLAVIAAHRCRARNIAGGEVVHESHVERQVLARDMLEER